APAILNVVAARQLIETHCPLSYAGTSAAPSCITAFSSSKKNRQRSANPINHRQLFTASAGWPAYSQNSRKVHHPAARQAAALFLIAPMIAVSMAPPAPPAITCEMMPWTLRLPDCAAAVIAGSNKVTICPSTPPPIKPEIALPIIPRSKVGDDLPTATPPTAPVTGLIKICSMRISQRCNPAQDYSVMTWMLTAKPLLESD